MNQTDPPLKTDSERLHRCLTGQLDEEEFRMLEAGLLASAEARSRYLRAVRMDAALHDKRLPGMGGLEVSGRGRSWRRPALIAAALLLGVFGWWGATGRRTAPPVGAGPAGGEIATVADLRDCRWKSAAAPGIDKRLPPGMLELESGVALIEFDSGARLALQGPARLELIDPNQACLHEGAASVRCDHGVYGFSLKTPTSTVIDLGTEFGVAVEAGGAAEVHVLDGEVEVADGSNQEREGNRFLGVGETLLLAGQGGNRVLEAPTREWVRDYSSRADREAKTASPKILARDPFPADLTVERKYACGSGWAGPWWQASNAINKGEFHFAPASPLLKRGQADGLALVLGWGEARRTLEHPVKPKAAGTLYVSMTLQRMNPDQRGADGKLSEAAVFLRSSEDRNAMLGFGLSGKNRWVVLEPGGWERSDQPVAGEGPFLLVARIEFNQGIGNKVSLCGYDLKSGPPEREPDEWDLVSRRKLARISAVLDVVALQARQSPFRFGEITLGNSWRSVVAPESVAK